MDNLFIIAEISGNHLGSLENAMELVRMAKWAGADAVKLQTFDPEDMAAPVIIDGGPWDGRNYVSLYAETCLPWQWHEQLFSYARTLGLIPMSSPFSVKAVEFLESIRCPIYKIASPEICHHQLIAAAARTYKPLIISTGMATLDEIYSAAEIAEANGAKDITFLHCISAYPAETRDFNLNTMVKMLHHNMKVGLSDHSLENTADIAAIALGATVIEKHLCLNRNFGGPDANFSLEPKEFRQMVQFCRNAACAMGEPIFGCRASEQSSYQYRRSIWLVKDLKEGETVTDDHLAILRPNYGAHPQEWGNIVGKTATQSVSADTPMSLEFVK